MDGKVVTESKSPVVENYVRIPAVILAAGRGSRLNSGNGSDPKPLAKVLGLTLLERSLLSLREAGINEFYVVVGYRKKKVISHVKHLRRLYGLNIKIIHNPDWAKGNGSSVLACAGHINSPFVLVMCDHLFKPSIVEQLLAVGDHSDSCYLAVDRKLHRVNDLEEATKVRLAGQYIVDIGKDIETFDAVDTGFFLCQPALFDALRESIEQGDGTLSGGLRSLIKRSGVKAVPVEEGYWLDIDTYQNLKSASDLLINNLDKKGEDGFVSRYINRPLSRKITGLIADWPVTPNQVSIAAFALGLIASFMFTLGSYAWELFGGMLVQLSSVIDGCDGELARLKFRTSHFGAWFDTILDRYADSILALGISYGYWTRSHSVLAWLGGILAITGFILFSYTRKEYSLRYRTEKAPSKIYWFGKRDIRLFVLFLGALVGLPFAALVSMGLLSHLGIAWMLLAVRRQEQRAKFYWRKAPGLVEEERGTLPDIDLPAA